MSVHARSIRGGTSKWVWYSWGVGKAKNLLRALRGTVTDNLGRIADPEFRELIQTVMRVAPSAATTAVPWLLRAREGNHETLLKVVQANAKRAPHDVAVEMGEERIAWSGLDIESAKVAHVLREIGVSRGDVVALIGKNSPSFIVNVLGATRLGAVSALINWHLEKGPLTHAVSSAGARVVLVEASLADNVKGNDELMAQIDHVLVYRKGDLEERMKQAPADPLPAVPVDAGDDFVYIYTSGTTGLPKPCRVSHARILIAGGGFGSLMFRFKPGDKLYCVLPLYHSSALLIGIGSCFVTRTPVALREQFSASAFWSDVRRYDATAMLYIGELCRYLVNREPCDEERNNRIRVAVGNGLRADVWEPFAQRFDVPEIREFYSATEAPGVIFNLTGKVGSIGHVPARRLGALKLAKYDVDADELVRDDRGLCIECEAGEVGHLVIRLKEKPGSALGDFRGYTDEKATQKKVARDVFEPGDKYFLSGDLLRFDDNDFFYFVDRIGDTYRWKGENVSTEEVGAVLSQAPDVLGATVSSVAVPGAEGRAGLAGVVCEGDFDAEGFWRTAQELPTYAQPRFVRVLTEFATTGTFKIQKNKLKNEGIDPTQVSDPLYLRTEDGYVPLTAEGYEAVKRGEVRL